MDPIVSDRGENTCEPYAHPTSVSGNETGDHTGRGSDHAHLARRDDVTDGENRDITLGHCRHAGRECLGKSVSNYCYLRLYAHTDIYLVIGKAGNDPRRRRMRQQKFSGEYS
jgi:hypothetical protein